MSIVKFIFICLFCAHGRSIVPVPFAERPAFSTELPFTIVEDWLAAFFRDFCVWALSLLSLIYTSFSSLMSCYLDYCSLINVEMDNVNPSSLFFSCSLLALPDLVPFHITLRIRLSISTKQIAGTVIEVLLNVGIKSERIDRIILSLAVHWHGISLHWFRSLFSFIRILFFLVFS